MVLSLLSDAEVVELRALLNQGTLTDAELDRRDDLAGRWQRTKEMDFARLYDAQLAAQSERLREALAEHSAEFWSNPGEYYARCVICNTITTLNLIGDERSRYEQMQHQPDCLLAERKNQGNE